MLAPVLQIFVNYSSSVGTKTIFSDQKRKNERLSLLLKTGLTCGTEICVTFCKLYFVLRDSYALLKIRAASFVSILNISKASTSLKVL